MLGCQLSQEKCDSSDSIESLEIDVVTLKSHIDLSNDASEIVTHSMDSTSKIVVNPSIHQTLNLFYSNSMIQLDDSLWRLLGDFQKKIPLFEFKGSQAYHKLNKLSVTQLSELKFFSVQLKLANLTTFYSRQSPSVWVFFVNFAW